MIRRVLCLTIFAAVVLLNCAADDTELRELLQEVLEEKANVVERHEIFLKANRTVNVGIEYLEYINSKTENMKDEELVAALTPICSNIVGKVFGSRFRNLRNTLMSAKGNVDYINRTRVRDGGKRLTDIFRELISDIEDEEEIEEAPVEEEGGYAPVEPETLMNDIIGDVRAVTWAFTWQPLWDSDDLKRDRQDLLDLINSTGSLIMKTVPLRTKCKRHRLYF